MSDLPRGWAVDISFPSSVDELPFNPTKAGSGMGNLFISAYSCASGTAKLATAAGASPASATGVGSLPPLILGVWGFWNFKSCLSAFDRAEQQLNEAFYNETGADATWKNFYGLLPGGTNYDDPGEPDGPMDYIRQQGWWKFISEFGYF